MNPWFLALGFLLLSLGCQSWRDDFTDEDISVLIGHSFGGALLESALTQTLEGLVLNPDSQKKIRWPANLIMFLNEAQQANRQGQPFLSTD